MSVAAIQASKLGGYRRIDAEYYQPYLLRDELLIQQIKWPVVPLGELVKEGYRVVYENTFIADEPFDPEAHVKFLQAADILSDFPAIGLDSMGWVSRDDWIRYPKGRVKAGEILVEVKGKVEKVAMVPDDFPQEVLITGTLYKMLVNENKVSPQYVLIYLLSRFGRNFRDRVKTNTLISFVSKEELYSISIPVPSPDTQKQISSKYQKAYASYRASEALYAQAQALLAAELGLDKLDLSESLYSVRNVSEVRESGRADAEFFSQRYQRILALMRRSGQTVEDFANLMTRRFKPQIGQPFNYIEIGDVNGDGFLSNQTLLGEEAPSRAQWIMQAGDVITSTVRPIRCLSALVEQEQEGFVCSSGFAVLQPKDVEPELLLLYLRLPIVCEVLDLYTTASMYPAISTTDLMNIPITLPESKALQKNLVAKVYESRQAYHDAQRLLAEAKAEVERMLEGA